LAAKIEFSYGAGQTVNLLALRLQWFESTPTQASPDPYLTAVFRDHIGRQRRITTMEIERKKARRFGDEYEKASRTKRICTLFLETGSHIEPGGSEKVSGKNRAFPISSSGPTLGQWNSELFQPLRK